jgi:hypothetical protein
MGTRPIFASSPIYISTILVNAKLARLRQGGQDGDEGMGEVMLYGADSNSRRDGSRGAE